MGQLLRSVRRQLGIRPRFALRVPLALWATASLAIALLSARPADAQRPPYFDRGLRWIGISRSCTAPPGWGAERLFHTRPLPAALADYCLYRFVPSGGNTAPSASEVTALFAATGAQGMTEDVPVLLGAAFSTEEEAVFAGLRDQLRAQVGDASLLPQPPARPLTRIVVIDSAPDAPHGAIHPGTSRHGDTLAHLIEDIVCRPSGAVPIPRCIAEVTTELTLPWIASNVPGANGGHIGTLADLARAIDRAVSRWQTDLRAAPSTTPPRLLLNLSVGWEHTPGIADCSTAPGDRLGTPARAVRAILQHAAAQGALIIAAAGNDAGGPTPRSGLVCPGRFQALPQDAAPGQALLVAVSGVDYHDDPLDTARPGGITGIAGLGIGGVAWHPADPVPPQLTGSSVATAVVSAVSAVVWAARPSWSPPDVIKAVHFGGVDVGTADECPLLMTACATRRASVCGALQAAGVAACCTPPEATPWSCPVLSIQAAALTAAHASLTANTGSAAPLSSIPRFLASGVQLGPWVFPMPIAATCPTCVVGSASQSTGASYLLLPELWQPLSHPMLVVQLAPNGTWEAISLGAQLDGATPYLFTLPTTWTVQSAYISGYDLAGYSVTEQILVQH